MAENLDLTGETIAATYTQLLHIGKTEGIEGAGTGHFITDANGTESVLSLDAGYVGIGTESPTALLTVGAITTLLTDGTTAVTPEGMNLHITEASKYAMGIKNADASGDGLIIQAGDASDDFALRVEDYDSANDLLVVQGGGNVGIGTASPADLFSLKADTSTFISLDRTANASIDENVGLGCIGISAVTSGLPFMWFGFDDSNVNQFVIRDDGNLGVGTTAPSDALHIHQTSAGDSSTTTDMEGGLRISSNANIAYYATLKVDNSGRLFISSDTGGAAGSSELYLCVDGVTKMTIQDSGQIGIGTSTPDTLLEVSGSFAANGPSSTFVTFADSDATPTVAGGNIFKHHASSQIIDNLDDGVCGQIITIISTDAQTYDFNAGNLKCGAADIVTGTGDVTQWVCDGTNWYLLAWMDVSSNLATGGGF